MKIKLPFFNVSLEIRAQLSYGSKPLAQSAIVAREVAASWQRLIMVWDIAPESIPTLLPKILQATLKGAALAILNGQANPLDSLNWLNLSPASSQWNTLSRRIASPRAMDPSDPFHLPRQGVLSSGRSFDQSRSFIGPDGDFHMECSAALKRMSAKAFTEESATLARAIERALLEQSAKPGLPGASASRL